MTSGYSGDDPEPPDEIVITDGDGSGDDLSGAGQSGGDNGDRREVRHRRRRTIIDVSVGISLISLLCYVVARFMIDGFLGPFFLSFQDTGLQYTDMVAAGAFLAGPALITSAIVYPLSNRLWKRSAPTLAHYLPRIVIVTMGIVLFFVLAGLMFAIYFMLARLLDLMPLEENAPGMQPSLGDALLLFALIIGVAVLFWDALRFVRRALDPDEPTRFTGPQISARALARPVGGFIFATLLLVALIAYAHYRGQLYAQRVMSGQRLHVAPFGLVMPGLRARPVRVMTPDGRQPLPALAGRCVMLLGQSDGTMVFFDPDTEKVLRFAAEAVATEDDIGLDSCSARGDR